MKTSKLNLAIASLALAFLGLSSSVSAGPISVGGGWTAFNFAGVGSSFSDEPYTFTLVGDGVLKVTDGYAIGDIFDVYDSVLGLLFSTSAPTNDGSNAGGDFDLAFADARWSSGSIALPAGSYSITGITTASPFGGGDGALQVIRATSAVPNPATLALFGLGLAGLGWSRRKRA